MSQPGGIVFDDKANLWVNDQCYKVPTNENCFNSNNVIPSVIAFSPQQIVISNSPTPLNPIPVVTLANATAKGQGFGGLAFEPASQDGNIGPQGGRIISFDQAVTVDFPEGALAESVQADLVMQQTSVLDLAELPAEVDPRQDYLGYEVRGSSYPPLSSEVTMTIDLRKLAETVKSEALISSIPSDITQLTSQQQQQPETTDIYIRSHGGSWQIIAPFESQDHLLTFSCNWCQIIFSRYWFPRIEIDPLDSHLSVGQRQELSASTNDGVLFRLLRQNVVVDFPLAWEVDQPNRVSLEVDQNTSRAIATALAQGEANIRAKANGFSSRVPAKITVMGAAQGSDHTGSILVQELNRTFSYRLPANPTNPALVIALHGTNGTGQGMKTSSASFDSLADSNNFIAVYPDALAPNRNWNATLPPDVNGPDDQSFISDLVDYFIQEHQVNPQKVYVTGLSRGGFMTYALAFYRPEVFTAFAPVAGSIECTLNNNCDYDALHQHATEGYMNEPILHIHGVNDNVVPTPDFQETGNWGWPFSLWVYNSGCDYGRPQVTQIAAEVKGYLYPQTRSNDTCRNSESHALILVNNQGHSWPDKAGFVTTEAIWDFFKRF
ncbi:MAG: PHB depolymerase family esterase [Deinococcales bacterium]